MARRVVDKKKKKKKKVNASEKGRRVADKDGRFESMGPLHCPGCNPMYRGTGGFVPCSEYYGYMREGQNTPRGAESMLIPYPSGMEREMGRRTTPSEAEREPDVSHSWSGKHAAA